MNTEKLFKNFHKKSKQEIATLVKQFIDDDLFLIFPELKDNVSIIITGSVSHGKCDKDSDIDLSIIFHNNNDWKEKKWLLFNEFKDEYLRPKKKPLELHGNNITSLEKLINDLDLWNKDWFLGEIAESIVVYDPESKFQEIKEKYIWYPNQIYKEKIEWLFAQLTFLIFDRYQNGYKRKNLYYAEVIKFKILRLSMLSLLLAHKKYPHSDKHLIGDIKLLDENLGDVVAQIETLIKNKNMKKVYADLVKLHKEIENVLMRKNLITKKELDYWLGLRPTQKVEIE